MKLGGLITDSMLLVGVGGVSYGAWLCSPAAGLITGGTLLLAGGLLRGLAESRRPAMAPGGKRDGK